MYMYNGEMRVDIDDYWTQTNSTMADIYFLARGIETWTGTDEVKTQALQRAWDYLKNLNWDESIFSLTQPNDIATAQTLLAHEELKSLGVLTPEITSDNYLESKNIGNGAISKTYRSGAPSRTKFAGIDALLKPYILSGVNVRIERG